MKSAARFLGLLPAVLAAALFSAGCATTSDDPGTSTGLPYRPPGPVTLSGARNEAGGPVVAAAPRMNVPANEWRAAAERWRGTPYRLGGDDRSGIDCSAFVRNVYREVAGIDLPRTSAQQWETGRPVNGAVPEPGDLVFFQTSGGAEEVSHVGLVVGGRDFAHASTRAGVTVSSLDDAYWLRRFVGVRRIAAPR